MSDSDHNEREDRELGESLERHLRALDSEDLLRLEAELRALVAMPGWSQLGELLAIHRNRVKAGTETVIWTNLSLGRSLDRAGPLHAAAGRLRGMQEPVRIIEKVLRLAEMVKRELGINDEETG